MIRFIIAIISFFTILIPAIILTIFPEAPDPISADGSIPMAAIIYACYDSHTIAIILLYITFTSTMLVIVCHKYLTINLKRGLLMLQELVLMIYAAGPLTAIINSSYADHVLRSRGFIITDQVFLFTVFIIHSVVITEI